MPFISRQPAGPPDPELPNRLHLQGMIFMFVVTLGAQQIACQMQEVVQARLGLVWARIGEAPPWHYIHRDFAQGVSSGGALLLAWTAALLFWKRLQPYSSMCVWMPWFWLGGHVAKACIIFRECPGLLDGGSATTSWKTFDTYIDDPDIAFSHSAVLWSGMAMSIALSWSQNRRRRKQTPEP